MLVFTLNYLRIVIDIRAGMLWNISIVNDYVFYCFDEAKFAFEEVIS